MKPLIAAVDVLPLLSANELIIVDARSGPDAAARYQSQHLRGAVHADLDRNLSRKTDDASKGGRHPLPSVQDFAAFLGSQGIGPDSHVIAYDDKAGANAAARFWWMLKALGHQKVQVIDGGFAAAVATGMPLASGIPETISREPYPATNWQSPTANIEDVERAAQSDDAIVIDVREAYRYRGESEPIDLVAGHIPGAVNIPYPENLDADGHYLPASLLAKKYEEILHDRDTSQVIVHCGSGVTACHTLLALEQAGIAGVNLYVGSWSEWSRTGRAVKKGEK